MVRDDFKVKQSMTYHSFRQWSDLRRWLRAVDDSRGEKVKEVDRSVVLIVR
jgi:hypothetical protein